MGEGRGCAVCLGGVEVRRGVRARGGHASSSSPFFLSLSLPPLLSWGLEGRQCGSLLLFRKMPLSPLMGETGGGQADARGPRGLPDCGLLLRKSQGLAHVPDAMSVGAVFLGSTIQIQQACLLPLVNFTPVSTT